jgi:ABC-type dipeptide/oligopeptide/nickel transport system permease subunit
MRRPVAARQAPSARHQRRRLAQLPDALLLLIRRLALLEPWRDNPSIRWRTISVPRRSVAHVWRGRSAGRRSGALRAQAGEGVAAAGAARRDLPFGADKWGHDIIKKTIKGGETSIVVGWWRPCWRWLGTLFGALSGYCGGVVDDFFNWFYSIFTAIPSVLMILAVAAVLQQKGVLTIVLILGLTGWTGPYRLIRAEYLKHKTREYVLAADAIGASHWRKMFGTSSPTSAMWRWCRCRYWWWASSRRR